MGTGSALEMSRLASVGKYVKALAGIGKRGQIYAMQVRANIGELGQACVSNWIYLGYS